ncbi:MAG: ABC transporter permease [Oscillospiraceae bacterium]|nr:ABC transporter permease [Oscillospiraceae bacterium]
MKSIKRSLRLVSIIVFAFIAGMIMLVLKIQKEASFYISHSNTAQLGFVYDRNGEILFDSKATPETYGENYFIDVGNLIGDAKGQMTNTLVANNIEKLNNYSFSMGLVSKDGKSSIHTSLDHYANRKVYDSFGTSKGCAVAYDYKTGEILVCTSLPSFDVTKGYADIENFETGTLISKVMYGTVPGSTQKVSTLLSAFQIMGKDKLFSKSYTCNGIYMNKGGNEIVCHNSYGHGTQNIQQAFQNSCNPFFAQLVEDDDMPLENIIKCYEKMGYAVNDDKEQYFDINGIKCERASTTLKDSYEFNTQWGCIGQGETLVSPMQLMMWQSGIANQTGKMTMPYLIKYTTNVENEIGDWAETSYSEEVFTPESSTEVRQIMLENGKNYSESISGYNIGIKSGTAQIKDGEEENSLLVGFIEDERHPIAFCVLLENKNNSDTRSENIVKTMLDALCQ